MYQNHSVNIMLVETDNIRVHITCAVTITVKMCVITKLTAYPDYSVRKLKLLRFR